MHLNVQKGISVLKSYDLDYIEGIIGSSRNAQIALKGATVKPEHARLVQFQGKIYIKPFDKDSIVYVNGQPIKVQYQLRENDIVNIGKYSLIFQREPENITLLQRPFSLRNFFIIIPVLLIIAIVMYFIPRESLNGDSDIDFRIEKVLEKASELLKTSKSIEAYYKIYKVEMELSDLLIEAEISGANLLNQKKAKNILTELETKRESLSGR